VNHLEAERPTASLAETADAGSSGQIALLRGREVKESKRHRPAPIGQARKELATAAICNLSQQDLAFHRHARAGYDLCDRRDLGPILIAKRQTEEQILDAGDSEPLEALR